VTEAEKLQARWLKKYAHQSNAHQVVLLTPLPARVRMRLAVHRRINRVGFWLVERQHFRAAELLWRACRMW
jgi:hypothetical protein